MIMSKFFSVFTEDLKSCQLIDYKSRQLIDYIIDYQ